VGPGCVVDQLLGIRVELVALRSGDRLPLVDQARGERAKIVALADAPMRQSGERTERVRRSVEDHLAPLRAASVGDRARRHPATSTGVGQQLDLLERCGTLLEGAERRVALHVPLQDAGLDDSYGRV